MTSVKGLWDRVRQRESVKESAQQETQEQSPNCPKSLAPVT